MSGSNHKFTLNSASQVMKRITARQGSTKEQQRSAKSAKPFNIASVVSKVQKDTTGIPHRFERKDRNADVNEISFQNLDYVFGARMLALTRANSSALVDLLLAMSPRFETQGS